VKNAVRLWPVAVAAVGIAGFIFAAFRWTHVDPASLPDEENVEPVTDLPANEHFEKVRVHPMDEKTKYVGAVRAGGRIPVRAPQGMRVAIVRVHHELGDFVKKGDVLFTFAREQIDKAIADAKSKGDTVSETRFRGYLDSVEIKAPCDGVVLSIYRTLGDVPMDDGIPLVELADKSSYRFVVQVPPAVQRLSMPLGSKFQVELQDNLGAVLGVVAEFEDARGGDVPVVLGLEPHEGIEDRLAGTVEVVSGRKEVGMVPKSAVTKRGDVSYVRVWDPDAKSVMEKSVQLGDAIGPDVVILAGVFVDESVVVPGSVPQK